MKRKLDTNDVPTPTSSRSVSPSSSPGTAQITAPEEILTSKTSNTKQPDLNFESLGLDPRLLQSIKKLGFEKPTRIQFESIGRVLQGKDLLARAKTGSGKTGAYVWGVLQGILRGKEVCSSASTLFLLRSGPASWPSQDVESQAFSLLTCVKIQASKYNQCTSALILVPTKELADQVYKAVQSFTTFCAKDIKVVNLAQKISADTQRNLLETLPDIVISTPSRAAENSNVLALETLKWLVIDEADLVLSYGHDQDLAKIRAVISGCQIIMMSATLSDEVDQLKITFSKNAEVLNLEEKDAEGEGVSQFVVQ